MLMHNDNYNFKIKVTFNMYMYLWSSNRVYYKNWLF